MKLFFTAFFSSMLAQAVGHTGHSEGFGWEIRESTLPKALSDHTASLGSDLLVYIAGGCDDPNGNAYTAINATEGFFSCGSISNAFYEFNPETEQFKTLQSLPQARYRHASVIVDNQLWLVGGRTIEDKLIVEVDVYNIGSGAWKTYPSLPEQYQVSDHAGFGHDNFVYIAGGYDESYTAQSRVYTIDVTESTVDSLVIGEVAPLLEPRGDITGVTADDGLSAFVSGGFSHENEFCEPLDTAEKYSFADNAWYPLPPLIVARGEVVLTELNNILYSLGGERQIEGICDITGQGADIGELTVGTDVVEIYHEGADWETLSGFPNHKFRFAAISWNKTFIYAFGGQTAYDNGCECFKTVNDVAVWGEGLGSSATTSALSLTVGLVAGLLGWAML